MTYTKHCSEGFVIRDLVIRLCEKQCVLLIIDTAKRGFSIFNIVTMNYPSVIYCGDLATRYLV